MSRPITTTGQPLGKKGLESRSADQDHKNQMHTVDDTNVCETRNTTKGSTGSKNWSETSQVNTVHIPSSMRNKTFLQHPGLTIGQKRYLCSIAKVYSTSHMNTLIHQYLDPKTAHGSANNIRRYDSKENK
ncbi:protein FAM216A [Spea bombifrons]|uniref:protein FAM216A n=1 Tax=Spea bombifrons TaxID=233779 RepID=UPI00234AEE65|nr:protein FAM216A [Spea bombifrons]